jgi:hypothetical protein
VILTARGKRLQIVTLTAEEITPNTGSDPNKLLQIPVVILTARGKSLKIVKFTAGGKRTPNSDTNSKRKKTQNSKIYGRRKEDSK